jgi:hypothetical protein
VSLFGKFLDYADGKRTIEIDILKTNDEIVSLSNFISPDINVVLFDSNKMERPGQKNDLIPNFKPITLMVEAYQNSYALPIAITHVTSISSFYVQLMSEEVQRYFEFFTKSLHYQCENKSSEIRRFNCGLRNQTWAKGHFAFFTAFTAKGVRWLRGTIIGTDCLNENICIQDFDSGIMYRVVTKELLRCPANSIFATTGRFAFECKLALPEQNADLEAMDSQMTERFKRLVQSHSDSVRMKLHDSYTSSLSVFPVQLFVQQLTWISTTGFTSVVVNDILQLLFTNKSQSNAINNFPDSSGKHLDKAKCLVDCKQKNHWQLLNSHNLNRQIQTPLLNNYLPARLPDKHMFKGRVTFVSDSLSVSVQPIADPGIEQPIHRINREILFTLFKQGRFQKYDIYKAGMSVTVYDTHEGTWNRGTIVEILQEFRLIVHLIDYGRNLLVHPDQISCQMFAVIEPSQALTFQLYDYHAPTVANVKSAAQKMRELLVDQDFQFEIRGYDPLEVRIRTFSGQDPFDELLRNNLICERQRPYVSTAYHNEIIRRLNKSQFSYAAVDFSKSDTYSIQLSSFSHRNYFWFQVNAFYFECNDEQQIINKNLVSYIKSKEDYACIGESFAPGQPAESSVCLALYNKQWYRALVLNRYADCDKFRVLFVDYGNTEDCALKE